MKHRSQSVVLMLLIVVSGMRAQTPKAPKAPPPARNELRPRPGLKGGPNAKNPEGLKGGGGQRLGTPGNPVERLMAMPPEKREQVLERLPPQQQANLRQRLERYDKLPPAERDRLNRMWSTFNSLPPEKQAAVTRQVLAFNSLPDARREELKPVLQRLRLIPEDRRNTLLNSDAFKNRFSPAELEMLTEISQNYPLPGR